MCAEPVAEFAVEHIRGVRTLVEISFRASWILGALVHCLESACKHAVARTLESFDHSVT